MPYLPTDWKDRAVDKPMTYTMQDNGDGTITLIPAEGNIAEVGTPLTAANLNHIEAGLTQAVRKDENTNMGGFVYSNMRIVLPQDSWVNNANGVGIDCKNSDISNINSLYFADTATSDSESLHWAKSTTPAGSTVSADYDALRVLEGKLLLNGKVVGSSDAPILWTGGYYLTSTQVLTPTKALQDCANGWILVWSDFDVGASPNDYDYCFTVISKNAAVYNKWHQAIMAGYSTATAVTMNAKQYAYTNTTVWGSDINNSQAAGNNNADVVLRNVVEF